MPRYISCFADSLTRLLVQARREAGRGGDNDDDVKSRSSKLNVSIDNLKDCTAQILAQVAALAKVN